eukprot:818378-Amphidinium_carterae.1
MPQRSAQKCDKKAKAFKGLGGRHICMRACSKLRVHVPSCEMRRQTPDGWKAKANMGAVM